MQILYGETESNIRGNFDRIPLIIEFLTLDKQLVLPFCL